MHRSRLWFLLPFLVLLVGCSRDPKAQAQRYVEQGNKFFEKEKFKEAAIMYRRAMQRDGHAGQAYYKLGLASLKLSAYSDAYKYLRIATDEQPDNLDAFVQLGDLTLAAAAQGPKEKVKLLEEAKEMGTKILAKDPNNADGHRLIGQVAQLDQDAETAVKELKIAHDLKPDLAPLALIYAEALAQNKQLSESEQLTKSIIPNNKNFAPAYDFLYMVYVSQKRLPEAEQTLKLKSDNNPTNGTYLLQLIFYYYATNQREAMDAALKRLDDDKNIPNGRLLAGDFLFLRLREFDRARQEYEAGVVSSPKEKSLYQKRLVELYSQTNRSNDANKLLASVLQADPNDSDAIEMRAALRLQTGSADEISLAASELQSLVTKTPNNHLLRFRLAQALMAKGGPVESEQARLQLETAIKLRPDFILAQELLGKLFLLKNEGAKALESADHVISQDPKNLQAHLTRSSALLLLNDIPKAHQELDFITQTYPQNADARYQVGFLAWQEKDFA
ncbi:MAG: tetratricopeptide repeat protein, partial [Acidobacteriota bacterium]